MQVAAGRAEELERTRPFGVLAAAFGCARRRRTRGGRPSPRCWPPRSGERGPITVTSDPGLQFRAVDAFTDLVEELRWPGHW